VLGTLPFYHSLALILLLGENHMGPTTLYETHFQSVRPSLISNNKGVSVRVSVETQFLRGQMQVL